MFIKAVFALILLAGQTTAFAGVYCCTKPDGKFEFRDTPCQTSLENQTFLPLSYEKTDPKQIKKQEAELKKTQQQLAHLQKKQASSQKRQIKQWQLEQDKAERQKMRCLRVQEKMGLLESQLRQGCKLKKSIRLQAELEQAERLKQRYCVGSE